jgi:hypothetical protein
MNINDWIAETTEETDTLSLLKTEIRKIFNAFFKKEEKKDGPN